ncbi:MAG TPA: hypothetical protein VEQ61_08635 [Thermoleophilaceae bacterium]|nr:hypothetical protein [Thermoleophilaceae bacterium]
MSPAQASAAAPAAHSLWRTDLRTLVRLLVGLWIFGVGEACLVLATLGNSPWTVLAEGVSEQSDVGIGEVTIAISFVVLLLWIPLRQRPGLGTVMNAIVVGLAIIAVLALASEPESLGLRLALVAGGIALVGAGSGLYLTCHLGPGPRDGLMTGLHARTGRSLRSIRTGIELGATLAGAALGGTVGLGTLAFALLVGPSVQLFVGLAGGLRPSRARAPTGPAA